MISTRNLLTVTMVCVIGLLPWVVTAQGIDNYSAVTETRLLKPEPQNWLMYRGTYDGWGYSPLDQIKTTNVKKLVPVWTLSSGMVEGHESPPIVNNGVMFLTTPGIVSGSPIGGLHFAQPARCHPKTLNTCYHVVLR
jgi:alcohol dehydrogenase (cytochrome c)